MEVVKAFMITKENGKNMYKMLNAWLRFQKYFMKKKIKDTKRERDRKENAWRAVQQFLIVFL